MKKYIPILFLFISFTYAATALLDFSDYDDNAEIKREKNTYIGYNPYSPLGVTTRSWNIGDSISFLKKYESKQRDINFQLGTTFGFFNSFGIHIKQYLNESKYKQISIFSSYSVNANILLAAMCTGDGCDGEFVDTQIISSGLDFNILRFNKFDLRLSLGLMGGYSFGLDMGGLSPFMYWNFTNG